MDLVNYLGKRIQITLVNGHKLIGVCNTFSGKADTENGLYDEITIKTNEYPYVGVNESEIRKIDIVD
ncbi:hypothetical protein BG261_05400 [Floricoccus tropicus]|uniref:LSM domain-containing protein n=1 Tax=Floricoccus tropicus TaxID=1859473 RepID=A0A1E8GLG7_9LACT|nr:hypothetical protein [Floricoccus tropicus]OFI48826.1 hypothetical protein BG261_05400 [Floricoccus tropicus]